MAEFDERFAPLADMATLSSDQRVRNYILSSLNAQNYSAGQTGTPLSALRSITGIPTRIAGHIVDSLIDQIKAPGQLSQPNPYPQGSEEAQWYENQRQQGMLSWAPGMALNTIGTGGLATLPAKVARTSDQFINRPGIVSTGDAARTKQGWEIRSPIKAAEDHYVYGPENQQALGDFGQRIAEDVGVEWHDPGLKKIERVQEKIADGKAPGRINDVVRGGFVVKTPEQAEAIARKFGERFPTADEGWASNQAGYTDRKLLHRYPNGQVGEVQIWNEPFAKYKGPAHDLFKQSRTLPKDDPLKIELENQQRALFQKALQESTPEWQSLFRR